MLYTSLLFLLGYLSLFCIMLILNEPISLASILLIAPAYILTIMFTIGYVYILSSITVYFRDLQHIIDAFSRIFFWITPIFYYTDSLTGTLNKLIWINPFTYFIELYHSLFYYSTLPSISLWVCCLFLAIGFLLIGHIIFHRYCNYFAERI